MTGNHQTTPTVFGYRSPSPRGWRWTPVAIAAFVAWSILGIFGAGLDSPRGLANLGFLVFWLIVLGIWIWQRRSFVTELSVRDRDLTVTTTTRACTRDLATTPVVAVTRTWGPRRLVLADGSSFRVRIQSRDWADFVAAIERAQRSPIDASGTGVIRTSSAWFRDDSAGYFVEA